MDKSWEVESYQEGNQTISVRHNMENDRVDEGDKLEAVFSTKVITHGSYPTFQVYRNGVLVAEVRQQEGSYPQIIPMRELTNDDEEALYRYLQSLTL